MSGWGRGTHSVHCPRRGLCVDEVDYRTNVSPGQTDLARVNQLEPASTAANDPLSLADTDRFGSWGPVLVDLPRLGPSHHSCHAPHREHRLHPRGKHLLLPTVSHRGPYHLGCVHCAGDQEAKCFRRPRDGV